MTSEERGQLKLDWQDLTEEDRDDMELELNEVIFAWLGRILALQDTPSRRRYRKLLRQDLLESYQRLIESAEADVRDHISERLAYLKALV